MAADSKQLKVLKRMTALLERINPTETNPALNEPFDIDLRQTVFRGKMILGSEIVYPAVAILESPTPFEGLHAAENEHKSFESWRLLVQGFAADNKDNPLDPAYALKAAIEVQLSRVIAVKKSSGDGLFPEDYLFGNLIAGLTISQGVVRPPDQNVSQYAYCYIPIIVKLGTDVTNPYAD